MPPPTISTPTSTLIHLPEPPAAAAVVDAPEVGAEVDAVAAGELLVAAEIGVDEGADVAGAAGATGVSGAEGAGVGP
jgi:hypothetical protein